MQLERNRAQETELQRHEETLRKYDDNERERDEDTLRTQQQEIARQQREAERVAETAKRAEEKKLREDELLRIKTEQSRSLGDVEHQERRSSEGRRQENAKIRPTAGHMRGHDVEVGKTNRFIDCSFIYFISLFAFRLCYRICYNSIETRHFTNLFQQMAINSKREDDFSSGVSESSLYRACIVEAIV